jgi:hypothetical protein
VKVLFNQIAIRRVGLSILTLIVAVRLVGQGVPTESVIQTSSWIKIDDFESANSLKNWTLADTQNETNPRVENPQVTEVRDEDGRNKFLIKKPAPEGIIGNRKALSFRELPITINVGEIYTFHLRLNVEYFSNNHVFGLSNLDVEGIKEQAYNALEPSLRVTDRYDRQLEAKNDGTLMVKKDPWYDKIYNSKADRIAKPMEPSTWYEIWMVINNGKISEGGQTYDVYIKGGKEFPTQQKVYTRADFRMKRALPLRYFMANCNTGSVDKPYGNGGLRYDDLYMTAGVVLTSPLNEFNSNGE